MEESAGMWEITFCIPSACADIQVVSADKNPYPDSPRWNKTRIRKIYSVYRVDKVRSKKVADPVHGHFLPTQ